MIASTPLSQSYEHWHGWPAPLSFQVNRWFWVSLAASISLPTALALRQHLHSQPTPSSSLGSTETLGAALGIVTALYSAFLLILSRKEKRLAKAEETMADIEDVTQTARMRSTITLLMVAVCQSFLAALFLYVGVRLIFLLRAPDQHAPTSHPLFSYGDFGFVLGQMGLMIYVIFLSVLHEATIETYLTTQEFRDGGEAVILMS